jgi:UrcA family protein
MNGFNRSRTMTTTTFSTFRNLMLAMMASATVLGFAAAPAEAGEIREARIAVGQSELSRAEGRQAVESRVLVAARRICAAGGVDVKNLSEVASYNLCVANAVRDGRLQMAAIASRTQMAGL